MNLDKKNIIKNFSRAASYYDDYSSVQDLCARELIRHTPAPAKGYRSILDIGCGTGNLTLLLRKKFPAAKITAIDFSTEMIRVAKEKLNGMRVEFIVADVENVTLKKGFDLIVSNACFQWLSNMKKTLLLYRDMLYKNGLIIFSMFGPDTLFELNESLMGVMGGEKSMIAYDFKDAGEMRDILKAVFKKASVRQITFTERHNCLLELLKKIKYTGARGTIVLKRGLWTSKIVDDIECAYRQKFKGIHATYQVFFCKARI